MKPLISIIIPVYNHANTIKKCLETVVKLSNPQLSLEIIIVNDGSADNFSEIIKKILSSSPEISALNPKIINQENLGAPAARNRGFLESTGDFVIFVDADTICYPKMLQEMYRSLELHPEASYAYSQFYFGWKKIQSHNFDPELLKKINYIDTTSLIRRKDFVPFDETLHRFQDWDLWLTLLENKKNGIFVPKVLFKKMVGGRQGISSWLPKFFYNLPFSISRVKKYKEAREIVLRKHGLLVV